MSQTQLESTDAASSATDSADAGEPTLALDTVFEILKNRRRRDILNYLWEHDGVANIGELAEHIAAAENGIEVAALSSAQRKRVYIGLYQCHLPKMDDAAIVDFDKHRGTIALRDSAAQLTRYLDGESDTTDPMPKGNLAVALGTATVVAAGIGVGVAPLVLTFVSTAALLLVTANQVRAGTGDGDEEASLPGGFDYPGTERSTS
ncbi:DUF7344 domain-containing protein [Halomarina ordinaria]|uniref:DUF7344 domain-containing protein n=1 Tax=Halomarina ordinaria TaxID=3033939 RepID=A0ABD5UDT4_9EURY|nr:hypothetical protein [Halomarina sp. PSRA2]